MPIVFKKWLMASSTREIVAFRAHHLPVEASGGRPLGLSQPGEVKSPTALRTCRRVPSTSTRAETGEA